MRSLSPKTGRPWPHKAFLMVARMPDTRRQGMSHLFLCQWLSALFFGLGAIPSVCLGADVIEFLSGAQIEGTVASIDKEKKTVAFETTVAGRATARTYRYSQIHAVTYQGRRFVLTEKSASGTGKPASGPT